MAENTVLNPGAGGDIAAADDIDGVKYQRVKLTLGAPGVNEGDASSSNPLPVSLASLPLPPGAAQDATVQALQVLTDTILCLLSAMLEKMPRVTGNDQCAVSIEAGSVSISGTPTTNVTTLSNITSIGGKQAAQIPDAISQLGALHLYQNITVS